MVEHLHIVPLVGEGDVLHVDAPLYVLQGHRVGLILQIGLNAHQLHEAAQAGEAVDQHLREGGELAHGVDEGAGVEAEGDEVNVVHLPVHDEPPAHGDHRHGDDAHEKLHGGVEPGHGPIEDPLGGLKTLVGPQELLALGALVGEGLGRAHTGDAGLDVGVDAGGGLLDLPGGAGHAAPVEVHHDEEHRDEHHHHQGQPPLDGEHDGDGPQDGHPGDEQVLGPVVGQLRDVEELGGHAAHQVAGAVFVVEAEGEGLQVAEEIPADVRLHQHAEGVPPEADHVLQHRAQQVGPQQHRRHGEEGPVAPEGDQLLQAQAGDEGKGQVNQGDGQRAGHVQQEQPQMGPEIAEKYAH